MKNSSVITSQRIQIRVGPALDTLPEVEGPFDLIFIDADKPNNRHYLEWAVRLSRAGLALMGSHPRLKATALQNVGVKGYDGFAIAIVQ